MAKTSRRRRSGARRKTRSTSLGDFFALVPPGTWGIVLLVVGILGALGLYVHTAGTVGSGLRNSLSSGLGRSRFLLPPLVLFVGVILVVERWHTSWRRVTIGSAIFQITVAALFGLTNHVPHLDAHVNRLRHAGGYVGALTGAPLQGLAGTAGALVILIAVLLISGLALTNTTVHSAMEYVEDWAYVIGQWIASLFHTLTTLGNDREESIRLDNQDTEVIDLAQQIEDDEEWEEDDDEPEILPDDDEFEDDEEDDEEYEDGEEAEYEDETEEVDLVDSGELAVPVTSSPAKPKLDWQLPPLSILKQGKPQRVDQRTVEMGGEALEEALEAHGVDAHLIGTTVGPTVTRYELELASGVKVSKVTSLNKDIAYAMAAADVRILAPIPGKSAIGIEVPNRQRELVTLHDILHSDEADKAVQPLEVALGRDISGRAVMTNMATMPHVLIAGATGAGKSSCINSIVSSILMRSTPDQVRLILVDPKRVELGQYNGLPHLLTPVVVNPKRAANALAWAVREMERRYDLLAEIGVRDITGYNSAFDRGLLEPVKGGNPDGTTREYERLPLILVVVDELNDLMMVAARDVENSICRIAQMARAVGIHMIVATQRPSVDVITGVIKANIPSRLAFAVSSLADSRVILDQSGAERLIGQGDMLLMGASSNIPKRIQGCWVSEEEVRKIVAHWRRQSEPNYVDGVEGDEEGQGRLFGGGDDDDDELLDQAMELVVRAKVGSTSMLQRKLRVGFARAGRLMDLLERKGVVGPSDGSKARTVLMTEEELEAIKTSN